MLSLLVNMFNGRAFQRILILQTFANCCGILLALCVQYM